MFCSFDKIFHPTPEEKAQQITFINNIVQSEFEKYGECCRTCQNVGSLCNPYSQSVYCIFDGHDIVDCELCDKYKRIELLKGE